MNNNIDLNLYTKFVEGITSPAGNNTVDLVSRLQVLSEICNPALMISSAMGLSGEAGEFSEIIKKVVFHGKELTPELRTHLRKELGDIVWYWINACRALEIDPNVVISDNVSKLESRYPGGTFSVFAAENRSSSDI